MNRMRSLLLLLLAAACAPTRVAVPVQSHNTVALEHPTVAVVAPSRTCQATADALVDALWEAGMRVDPEADRRVEVIVCGDDLRLGVEEVQDDGETARRTVARARAHALVVVRGQQGPMAHLLGTGRHEARREGQGMAVWQRDAATQARRDAATDLVQQLSPDTVTVARKVWPNAPHGSARELTTMAVRAEQRGDLGEALLFALAAHDQRPTPRTAGYLVDLRRRLAPTF